MARTRIAYGPSPEQFGHLYLPDEPVEGKVPLVVVIHGGSWHARYGLTLGTSLARELARRGIVAWNIEYRRLGAGGHWPEISADVRAAFEAIRTELVPHAEAAGVAVDLDRVRLVGHSAGGQLAVWLAGEDISPKPERVVSQAGALDLASAGQRGRRVDAFEELFGVSFDEDPQRYRAASPMHRVPIGVPVAVLHGDADVQVPVSVARRYVEAAKDAGDPVSLHVIEGEDHVAFLDRTTGSWQRTLELLTAEERTAL